MVRLILPLLLAGCGAATPPPDRPTPPAGSVVVRTEAGLETRAVDDAGRVLGREAGATLEVEGARWRWETAAVEIPLWDTLPDEESPDPRTADRSGTMWTAAFVSGARRIAVAAVDPALVARDVTHEVSLEAVVGPLAFVRETTHLDVFGAHGSVEVVQHVIDLRSGERVALDVAEEARVEARRRLEAREPLEDEVELVAVHPRWTERGLRVEARFATSTCYACTDGSWSDYRRSVTVETEVEALAAVALPAWVSAGPDEEIVAFGAAVGETPTRGDD